MKKYSMMFNDYLNDILCTIRRKRNDKITKRNIKNHKKYVKKYQPHVLSVYFGVPGSGKTTFAAWLAKRDLKRGLAVYSNVPITGTYQLDVKRDIGHYMITDARIIIDEAGVEYNNRNYKAFTDDELYFFKYHRHYETAVDIFSQGYDDMDKKLRTLAQRYYVVKKSCIPFFIYRHRIAKKVGIDEVSKQIIDEYYFAPFGRTYIFSPLLWSSFNTLSRKQLPESQVQKW